MTQLYPYFYQETPPIPEILDISQDVPDAPEKIEENTTEEKKDALLVETVSTEQTAEQVSTEPKPETNEQEPEPPEIDPSPDKEQPA